MVYGWISLPFYSEDVISGEGPSSCKSFHLKRVQSAIVTRFRQNKRSLAGEAALREEWKYKQIQKNVETERFF